MNEQLQQLLKARNSSGLGYRIAALITESELPAQEVLVAVAKNMAGLATFYTGTELDALYVLELSYKYAKNLVEETYKDTKEKRTLQ